ncbi:MAG: hypothetical protein QM642_09195 [Edaphocola sp.]
MLQRMVGVAGIIGLSLLFSAQIFAENVSNYRLFELAGCADVITYGLITKVDAEFYYLNCGKAKELQIKKASGGNGHFRWAKYEAGQRVFVFLKKNGPIYELYGNSFDSELPVINDSLVVPMDCFMPQTVASLTPKGLVTPEYRKLQTFRILHKEVFGLRFSPSYLYANCMALRDCYQVVLKQPNKPASFNCFNFFDRTTRARCEPAKRQHVLMRLMFQDMERAQYTNCHAH